MQETTEIVSLFDVMDSVFEELNMDYSRNSTGPVERSEMMGNAEMIGSLLEVTDFSSGRGEQDQRAEVYATF